MPVHDWSQVEAGIFHHFHHAWIEEISRELNAGMLPADYYALAERHSGPFGPDALTLQTGQSESSDESATATKKQGALSCWHLQKLS